MKEIHLGRVVMENRRNKGITQGQLAEHMGVSKAAVSKWETGSALPDIALLPKLAAFFNISIDELLGYEPHMGKQDIRKLYRRLSREFSCLPFREAEGHCLKIAKEYFSCFPLLFQLGALLVNHSMLAGGPAESAAVLEEAKGLFVRVKTHTDDIGLAKQAQNMEALCMLSLQKPEEVLKLLGRKEPVLLPPEPLLASAYQMLGKPEEARGVLQAGIYQYVVGIISLLTAYLNVCANDLPAFEETCRRGEAIAQAFQLKTLHPASLLSFYLAAAQGFMENGMEEKALSLLEEYARLTVGDIYPLRLQGDGYFDLLDDWIENTLDLGDSPPRDEAVIRKSMTQAVTGNPAFAPLGEKRRFQKIVQRLQENEGGSYGCHCNGRPFQGL